MRRFLVSFAILAVVASACGEESPTSTAQQALIPAPYVCPNQTDVATWPDTGNCYWQPANSAGAPHVQVCTATGQDWGFVHLYSEKNFGGACAAVWTNDLLVMDAPATQLNGWLACSSTRCTQIKSLKVGPGHMSWGGTMTSVRLSSGPDPADPAYHSSYFPNPTSGTLAYADILAYTGHQFAGPIYSFLLAATP
jgi:hypothetical protein